MGHGMAGRYIDSGFSVAVWNRSRAQGGRPDRAWRDMGRRRRKMPLIDADAVVTMVADDEASQAVWLDQGRRSRERP